MSTTTGLILFGSLAFVGFWLIYLLVFLSHWSTRDERDPPIPLGWPLGWIVAGVIPIWVRLASGIEWCKDVGALIWAYVRTKK